MAEQFVILGGNIAGVTAAEALRAQNPDVEITVIERGSHPLYSRVLLPHYIKGKVPRERVFLKDAKWFQDRKIDLQLGVEARRIDTTNQFVATSDEREIPYTKLLITTGGEVNMLPQDMKGVCYFRTIDDADYLLECIHVAKRAAVLGGGFISLELINIFKHFNLPTTVVLRSGGFWSQILSPESQFVLHKHITDGGIPVIVNEPSQELLGADTVEGVQLSNGDTLPADIVGIGIGIHPETFLFDRTDIKMNRGILANEYLETTAKNVYTAGDIAEFDDVIVGRRVQQGNWMNAQMQARTVAKTMSGERTRFELVSSYATSVLGKEIVFIGDVNREHADNVRQLAASETHALEVFDRGSATVGAVLIGEVTARQAITNAIKTRTLFS